MKPILISILLSTALTACNNVSVKPQTDSETDQVVVTPTKREVVPIAIDSSAPQWRIGDQWRWSDGYALEVSAFNKGISTLKRLDAENQWQKRDGLFTVESQSATTLRKVVYRTRNPQELFPLIDGKQSVFRREYLANGQLRVHNTSWSVEGKENITVPAGSFDCWILVRRTRSQSTDWVGFERLWYSPEIKNYARMEYQYGEAKPGSRVLLSYTLK